jgi:hypothetical protein
MQRRVRRYSRGRRFVMRGLDPRIHQKIISRFSMMDCRVKPGNDTEIKARP